MCAERLRPQLGEYVKILRGCASWPHDESTTQLLLTMSLATIKRRINKFIELNMVTKVLVLPNLKLKKKLFPLDVGHGLILVRA